MKDVICSLDNNTSHWYIYIQRACGTEYDLQLIDVNVNDQSNFLDIYVVQNFRICETCQETCKIIIRV